MLHIVTISDQYSSNILLQTVTLWCVNHYICNVVTSRFYWSVYLCVYIYAQHPTVPCRPDSF